MKHERRAERARAIAAAAERAAETRHARLRGAAEGQHRGCLLCRRRDGGFTAPEHVFPETLGNRDIVLPVGVVCDRCNHGVCALLDQALCSFGPIHLLRAIHRQPSKAGKLPSMNFDNGRIEATAPDHIEVSLAGAKWHRDLPAPPGYKAFEFTAKRNDITSERLSLVHRALVKQALELAWRDLGEERALGAEFDREREIVLGGGHSGYIAGPRQIQFAGDFESGMEYVLQRRTSDGHPMIFLRAFFWSVPFITDTLLSEPCGPLPYEFLVWCF